MITLRLASKATPAVTLAEMSRDDADLLGPAFAAMEPWSVYPMSAESMTAYFATIEPGAPRYVLKYGDEIAGAVGVRLNWLRGPYLQILGMLPAHQNAGIGDLALKWFELAARARGDRNLWVAVSDFNADAERFYARFGFERVADLPDLISDGKTEVLMRKRIGTPSV